ncbi:glycoside hydrolase family 19 protein [Sphingomonas sp. OTU376]|uniref:glycoside hydrolase family 19 protein n=1 Tax=Sphingomonas sp. OTU376 TaxID=3043863 RepID=UPI00313BD85D
MFDARPLQGRLAARGYSLAIDGSAGPKTLAALLAFIGRQQLTPLIAQLGAAAAQHLPSAEIITPLRVAHALAQWAVETGGFAKLEENLNYSATRLRAVWPSRFPTPLDASLFAHKPEHLAEKVYGGRGGNAKPGDGWLYRGRGPTMLTFHDNYADAQRLTGVAVLASPDLVATPDVGMLVACAYWRQRNINAVADCDDLTAVRVKVNGGKIGLEQAQAYLRRAKLVLLP